LLNRIKVIGYQNFGLLVPIKTIYSANLKPPMFKPMMQELLNIKQFCEKNFKQIKTMFLKEIGASSWYYKKALD
jgi:hypothetical protein